MKTHFRLRHRICLIMIGVLIISACSFVVAFCEGTNDDQSSFDFKRYRTQLIYRGALKLRMKDVSEKLSPSIDDADTFPIPGLIETKVYTSGSIDSSDDYIPQGICSTGDYWLISAYDVNKKSPSVIYVVDAAKRSLISTLTLPNKYHVGGLAFDGKRIWFTGETSDRYKGDPFLQYIDYDDFQKMKESSLYEVSKDEISKKIKIKNKPSFLEYDNGKLWVGTYIGTKSTREAYMYGYPVIENKKGRASLNTILFSVLTGLDSSTQGVDIDGNDLYVSSSYKGNSHGAKSSFITRYDISPINNGTAILNIAKREKKRIEVPKMNEEILVEDGKIFINFEAGAKRWLTAVIQTDRILAVDESLWGKKK